jgi:Protein of unknown function (DUF1573)
MKMQLLSASVLAIMLCFACKNEVGTEGGVQTVQKPEGENASIVHNGVSASQSSDTVNVAMMMFEEPEFNFGEAKQGDVVKHEFKFKNTGRVPLLISDARSTCGCTVPEWPKEAIPVGGEGVITAKFNTEGKVNTQTKVITVTANTYPSETKIVVTGNVLEPKKKKQSE